MNMTAEIIATWVGLLGLGLSYLKDRSSNEREYGRLEQKVTTLEGDVHNLQGLKATLAKAEQQVHTLESEVQGLNSLRREVHTLSVGLARVETKLDAILTEVSRNRGENK
jgi:TolA-binding protein